MKAVKQAIQKDMPSLIEEFSYILQSSGSTLGRVLVIKDQLQPRYAPLAGTSRVDWHQLAYDVYRSLKQ